AALISLSVPSTPTRSTLTSTPRPWATSDTDGLASSARCTLLGRPGTTAMAFMGFSTLLQQLGDQRGPSGLVARADRRAGVAVEILVKRNQIVPVRIGLKTRVVAEDRPAADRILQEDSRQPPRQLGRHLAERQHPAGTGRDLDPIVVAEIVMELLQRFDDQEIDWKPDRSAPVRVAAEQTGRRFGRLVVDPVVVAVDGEHIRMVTVNPRDRSDAEGRQELALVEHHAQDATQSVAIDNREQAALTASWRLHARHVPGEIGTMFDEPFEALAERC